MQRSLRHRSMESLGIPAVIVGAVLMSWAGASAKPQSTSTPPPALQEPSPSTGKQASTKAEQAGVPALPRGKKLFLKDGSFQLLRDYHRTGERFRYIIAHLEHCD